MGSFLRTLSPLVTSTGRPRLFLPPLVSSDQRDQCVLFDDQFVLGAMKDFLFSLIQKVSVPSPRSALTQSFVFPRVHLAHDPPLHLIPFRGSST